MAAKFIRLFDNDSVALRALRHPALTISRVAYVALAFAGLLSLQQLNAIAQPTPGQTAQTKAAQHLPFVSLIFGDNVVPQRGKPDTIWSWSDPDDKVRVEIGDHSATATSGSDHRGQVKTQPPERDGHFHIDGQYALPE